MFVEKLNNYFFFSIEKRISEETGVSFLEGNMVSPALTRVPPKIGFQYAVSCVSNICQPK